MARTSPCETLSPTRTLTSRMRPASVAGTSIVAFSDSNSTSGASFSIVSPVLMNTEITGTPVKPPMSGTTNSVTVAGPAAGAAAAAGAGAAGAAAAGAGAGAATGAAAAGA